MGLFGDITTTIIAKYKADTKEAEAAVRSLAGEQKKAAKEAAEAYKKQGEAFEANVANFAKGLAIIGGAIAVGKSSWNAYRNEVSMSSAAAGVSIDRLSDAYDGLKTRTELLTLAQAGHQGAWKLTTSQIEQVITGMRALEAEGYNADKVFAKFTDVMHKGKVEGLDDFGLSIKSTGDQTKDLQVLLNALGKEALSVGNNFARAGDDVVRASVRMEDGITRVRVKIGEAVDGILNLAAAAGGLAGRLVFGNGPDDVGTGGRVDAYARAFQARRGATAYMSGRRAGGAEGVVDRMADVLPGPDFNRYLMSGPSGADRAAANTLSAFKSAVNKGMQGWGPLASASPEEFAKAVAGLPKDWEKVDTALAAQVDDLRKKSGAKWMTSMFWWGVDGRKAVQKGVASGGRRGGGRSRGASGAPESTVFDDIVGAGSGFLDFAMGEAASRDAAFQNERDAYNAKMSQRFADAQTIQNLDAQMAQMAADKKQSFLERTFGKLEEFDAYAAGFATLKGAAQDGFAAWISGSESLGKAIKKSIAQSLAAYAVEMSGRALVAGAHALFNLATGDLVGAAAMGASAVKYTAAAAALGVLAKAVSPGGASAGAGGGGASTSTGGGATSAAPARLIGSSPSVVFGEAFADDSPRYRQRAAMRALSTPTAYQPPRGVAA